MIQPFKIYQTRLLLLLCVFAGSCEPQKTHITVKGDVKNLPDGTMYITEIYPEFNKSVDSTEVRNGKFKFKISSQNFPESPVVKLHHIDKNGLKTIIGFPSKRKIKGHKSYEEKFMLEDGVEINGRLVEYKIDFMNISENIRLTNLNTYIKGEDQNKALSDDTLTFSTLKKLKTLEILVKQNPDSYHYLYELKKRTYKLSNSQFDDIFEEFDDQIKQSQTGKELKIYVQNRMSKRLNFETRLIDQKGNPKPVLDRNARINMVVLWASWCGPCRKEIPLLKALNQKFKNETELNLVSVSLDEDPQLWQKAMDQEKMNWAQFIITPELKSYQRDLFQFDGSIPTTLFIDKSGKIIHKLSGYNEKEGLAQIEDIISRQMGL